jgi:hypothetical protein
MIQYDDLPDVEPRSVGALPLLNRFLERLKLKEAIDAHVERDKREKIEPSITLLLLLRNVLLSRRSTRSPNGQSLSILACWGYRRTRPSI